MTYLKSIVLLYYSDGSEELWTCIFILTSWSFYYFSKGIFFSQLLEHLMTKPFVWELWNKVCGCRNHRAYNAVYYQDSKKCLLAKAIETILETVSLMTHICEFPEIFFYALLQVSNKKVMVPLSNQKLFLSLQFWQSINKTKNNSQNKEESDPSESEII